MNPSDARSLKSRLLEQVQHAPRTRSLVSSARTRSWEGLAIGLVLRDDDDASLGLRATSEAVLDDPTVSEFLEQFGNEIEVEITGPIRPQQANTGRVRPLRAGWSIGHHRVTAGTLGAFVTDEQGRLLLLSNNHVLADSNSGTEGDPVLQPGPDDGGANPEDLVARLTRFIPIRQANNLVDAAIAEIAEEIEITSDGARAPTGGILDPPRLQQGLRVMKVGRTTGETRGQVSLIETDDVPVDFGGALGLPRFDEQIEIKGDDGSPFSKGGDSGSLIVTEEEPDQAVALLFAGGDGPDGSRTFASPIEAALTPLGVTLVS